MARPQRPSLVEPFLKTTRAKVHLDALQSSLEEFRKSKPVTFHTKANRKTGRYEIRIEMRDTPNEVPLILGDLVFCLRSALDQAVWQLARLTTQRPERTQFPILEHDTKKSRKDFEAWTTGVPRLAVRVIKSLQPFQRAHPREHLLWKLNKLCNIDKHRRVPIHGDMVPLHFPEIARKDWHLVTFSPDHHLVSAPLSMQACMGFDRNVSLEVRFGDLDEGLICTFDEVCMIYEFVSENVIPRFKRFFR